MKHKISASSLFTREYILIHDEGVKYCGTRLIKSVRRFRFNEIHCVLMAPDFTLSFQVGDEVFSIRTNPASAKHQAAIAALVERLQASCPFTGVPALEPL